MIVDEIPWAGDVDAWFTGRDRSAARPAVGSPGNLSHRRPHRPQDLARDRLRVGHQTRTDPASWHFMRQVHGAEVGVVDARVPRGAELRGVDAIVTALTDRPLVVQVADCVPVLLASPGAIAAVHAGRKGVAAGVVAAAVRRLVQAGSPGPVQAVIGPAIGGCCYEVPEQVRDEVLAVAPAAAATTTWRSPSLDLPGAVERQLGDAGVTHVRRSGGCTRCDARGRWFSHRADPASGRQVGLIVRRSGADA